MTVNLFYIVSHPPYGGFVTYTNHLHRMLAQLGHDVNLYMVKKRFEEKHRDLHGTPYQNVDVDFAIHSCRKFPTLIVCMYWKTAPEVIEAMLKNGARLVIHDPTELVPELIESVLRNKTKVIAIRKKNLQNYIELGMDATYVPHPYVEFETKGGKKTKNACATSRLDFDKHTEVIAEANEMLTTKTAVQIYGKENRLFTWHKVKNKFPEWERYYNGAYPKEAYAGVKVALPYRYLVDMSLIRGDGGGTQYTFFEAWNAGCELVLDERWILPGDELEPGKNCHVVNGAEQLVKVLKGKPNNRVVEGGRELMREHGTKAVGEQLKGLFQ